MKLKKASFSQEKKLWQEGVDFVIGIDEVGRGAFAGPIVAAAVIFPKDLNVRLLSGVNDSKLLKFLQRKMLAEIIKKHALFWSVEQIEISYINKHGIEKANSAVFRKVLNLVISKIESSSYLILIDGYHKKYLPGGLQKQKSIIKGDRISLSIAAASILAKVYRDNLMRKLGKHYFVYRFDKNKGYGTKFHQDAIKKYGLSTIHRASFDLHKFL